MGITTFKEDSELAGGRYRLECRLGRGGMATVWRGLDTRLARSVAIKLPSEALTGDETFAIRFEREAQTAAALSHPHLVSVFDFGTEGERPYLVSEFIDGSNLAELRDRKRPPETEVLARTLLEALAHIHAAGIVHRDVKPGNVLVDHRGRILLTDFGIAQSTEETSLTKTGNVIGTYSYIAPEVKRGARAGPASDLYSLGVLLSEQLTHDDPDRVHRLVDALTQVDPADRPPSAERALEMLERSSVFVAPTTPMAIEEDPIEATATRERTPPPRSFPLPPQSQEPDHGRRYTLLGAGLGALLVAMVIGIAFASGGGQEEGGSDRAGDGSGGSGGETKTEPEASTTPSTDTADTTEATTPAPDATTASVPEEDVVATEIDPARGAALNNEGFALLQAGDVEGALPKLEQAVASFPTDSTEIDYAFALFNYARALRLSGDPEAAIPLLERRLSFSDFRVEDVQAELATAQAEAAGKKPKP